MPTDAELAHYEQQLRDYARLDWVYAPKRYDRLHAVGDAEYDPMDWLLREVTMVCGWRVDVANIPGIFSRMSLPRCAWCCESLGYPRGIGSPKNDDTCRALLGLAVKA